MMADEAEVTAV